MTELTDQQLLMKMHGGHHAAAELLWKRLSPRLLVHARTLAREGSLAEDSVQAAFVRVLSLAKREVSQIKDPLPWLMMVVRREVIQALRAKGRATRRERRYGGDGHTCGSGMSQSTSNDRSMTVGPELREQLEAELKSLPRREREVIMLRHFVMLTFDQMELALGVPRSTVVSRYRAAIARLEARMQPGSSEVHVESHTREGQLRVKGQESTQQESSPVQDTRTLCAQSEIADRSRQPGSPRQADASRQANQSEPISVHVQMRART